MCGHAAWLTHTEPMKLTATSLRNLSAGILGERAGGAIAGVVDHDIDPSERVERRSHRGGGSLLLADAVRVGNRLAACRLDFFNRLFGGKIRSTAAVQTGANVVDHHSRSPRRQQVRIGASQTVGGAGHQRHSTIKAHFTHVPPPCMIRRRRSPSCQPIACFGVRSKALGGKFEHAKAEGKDAGSPVAGAGGFA